MIKTAQRFFEDNRVLAPRFFGTHVCTIVRCQYNGEIGCHGVYEEGEDPEHFDKVWSRQEEEGAK